MRKCFFFKLKIEINMFIKLLFVVITIQIALAKEGFGPTEQDWGYISVKEKAHVFWWLHYTIANVTKHTDRPLILWLQGGPGASSTGYGNFAELGPIDLDFKPRKYSWVNWANVLFVDYPAGAGFGYVESNDSYVKNNTEVGIEFLVFFKEFLEQKPEFKTVPIYIFCESYGGKMVVEIALVIDKAIKSGEIDANFKGIGLGDAYISPIHSILSYAPYLYNLGLVDDAEYKKILSVATKIKDKIYNDDWEAVDKNWIMLYNTTIKYTKGVSLYNILDKIKATNGTFGTLKSFDEVEIKRLNYIMNTLVKSALNLTRKWVFSNIDLHYSIKDQHFPATDVVEALLNTTDLKVAVYNGQLDLIVNTPGQLEWINRLNFKDKDLWNEAPRNAFAVDGYYEGYVKKYGNFAFYWVNGAGHMVPADNPKAMYYILYDVTDGFKV